jgi:hypothetical protein
MHCDFDILVDLATDVHNSCLFIHSHLLAFPLFTGILAEGFAQCQASGGIPGIN